MKNNLNLIIGDNLELVNFYLSEIMNKIGYEEEKKIECPICGEIMEKYLYDYDSSPEEKINYKCPNCGHRESILKQY